MHASRKDMISRYLKYLTPFSNSTSPLNQVNDTIRLMNKDKGKLLERNENERSEPMCDLGTQEAVATVVKELIKQRVSFTGYDVYTRMHNKLIRRGVDYTNNRESPKVVSQCVRQLFNSGDAAFTDYGSMLIPGNNGQPGPVMYFALPYSAKLQAKKIAGSISKQSAQDTNS